MEKEGIKEIRKRLEDLMRMETLDLEYKTEQLAFLIMKIDLMKLDALCCISANLKSIEEVLKQIKDKQIPW